MKGPLLTGAALSALLLLPSPSPAAPLREQPDGVRPAPNAAVDFLVHLPVRNTAGLENLIELQNTKGSPLYHHYLTPAQFRESFGPSRETMSRAAAILRANGLAVTKADTQMLHVRGASATVERAFGVQIRVRRNIHGAAEIATKTPLQIPQGLQALGASVGGLRKSVEYLPQSRRRAIGPDNRKSPTGNYWFDDLKQAYNYPSYTFANGKGITIATVGLSDFLDTDAASYFAHERLGSGLTDLAPAPTLKHLVFPGSLPFNPKDGNSDEASLDVQQSGGSAPGATIIGVAAPAVGEGFLYAYSYIDDFNVADIVSTSYGGCELGQTAAYNGGQDFTGILRAYHEIFLQGNSQGITFLFSSGDNAGKGCPQPGYFIPAAPGAPPGLFKAVPAVQFWADDPAVTAVGGTNLVTSFNKNSLQSTYVRENDYYDRFTPDQDPYGTGNYIVDELWGSGGGESTIWPKPDYQRLVRTNTRNRAVPDVSMHMGGCPAVAIQPCGPDRSGDYAYVGGGRFGFIGTSASAPEFAGLLAVKEQIQGSRLGNENYDIYELAKNNDAFPYHFFHQGIPANNGVVRVVAGQKGYNLITGVGTPYASNFAFTPFAPLAGDPQTATNP